MRTPLAVALVAAVTGLASTASADAPTLDQRVAAVEAQIIALSERVELLEAEIDLLDASVADARLLGRCIRVAEAIRFVNGFAVHDPKAVGARKAPSGKWTQATKGVYWIPLLHPKCAIAD